MTALALEPLRGRLSELDRTPGPMDIAAAMRAEGMIVTDAGLIEVVEA